MKPQITGSWNVKCWRTGKQKRGNVDSGEIKIKLIKKLKPGFKF